MSNQITMLETLGDALKTAGKFAAKTWAPKLTDLAGSYSQNIKTVLRSFNQPKAALDDLFKQNPDTFRDCKLKKLEQDSAAGIPTAAAGAPADNKYKGSYKAIFSGSVKEGSDANASLITSNNFSVTIKPTKTGGYGNDLKYIADQKIFKDDVEFATVSSSVPSPEIAYKKLFSTLTSKFTLNSTPNFNSLGDIQKGRPDLGMKLNFDGTVTFPAAGGGPGGPRRVENNEYIIVINKDGRLQSDGKLYSNTTGSVLNASVIINYNQKNILFESKKLVDSLCK